MLRVVDAAVRGALEAEAGAPERLPEAQLLGEAVDPAELGLQVQVILAQRRAHAVPGAILAELVAVVHEALPLAQRRQGGGVDQDGADLDDLGLLARHAALVIARGLQVDDQIGTVAGMNRFHEVVVRAG
jgi:hypothetical protein